MPLLCPTFDEDTAKISNPYSVENKSLFDVTDVESCYSELELDNEELEEKKDPNPLKWFKKPEHIRFAKVLIKDLLLIGFTFIIVVIDHICAPCESLCAFVSFTLSVVVNCFSIFYKEYSFNLAWIAFFNGFVVSIIGIINNLHVLWLAGLLENYGYLKEDVFKAFGMVNEYLPFINILGFICLVCLSGYIHYLLLKLINKVTQLIETIGENEELGL